MKVSVIGLGKLGACYAAFYASKGSTVIGADLDQQKVDTLNAGKAPVAEPELDDLIKESKERLRATTDITEAVLSSNISFVIVPTPSAKDGSFSVDYAIAALKEIGKALRKKKTYHLISLVSTVLPGDSRKKLIPAIERASGKKCGADFGYCYNPSLIALGDIIANLRNPDFLFLGAFDKKSGDTLAKAYAQIYPERTPERMSIESVELAKIALNSYVTMKITFANVLGMLAEKIPHANVDDITAALGKDKRIGSAYLKSGLGYGGPCFPRDNFAFAHMAKQRGIDTPLALATHRTNAKIPRQIAARMHNLLKGKRATIGFLGVSYKPRTTITEESQALAIAKILERQGYRIAVYEPLGFDEAQRFLGSNTLHSDSLVDLAEKSDMIFVSNKDSSFSDLPNIVKSVERKVVIVDPWGMFSPESFGSHGVYHALGRF